MMGRLLVAFCLLGLPLILSGQNEIGSGRAISFDGKDDYISLGNVYDDLTLPLTISAWIFLDPGGLGTIFSSQDDPHVYSGFHFYVIHSAIVIEYGDGLGPAVPENRRGKSGSVNNIFGRWVHVAAVMRGASDMDLFLNGVNIGGDYIGTSQFPMMSAVASDTAKIGFRSTIGLIYHFEGMLDELQLWNRPLSEDEIREQMCRKLTGNEPGLIGYWDFNDPNFVDKSPSHVNGQPNGNPGHVFSGAPIGDKSVLLYPVDWHDQVLSMRDSLDQVSVVNVAGNPAGLHMYEVHKFPSQSKGLNLTTVAGPYFGIFAASDDTDNFFDVNYTFNDSTVCKLLTRPDNSFPTWKANAPQLTHVSERTEVIKELYPVIKIDLGPDEVSCAFDNPRKLTPLSDTTGFQFSWQDGSTLSTYRVSDLGTYWVTADDGCTGATDTLKISSIAAENLVIPNVFTPNGDSLNPVFEIDQRMLGSWMVIYNRWGTEVYQNSNYQNDWDGEDLPAGVYFYRIIGGRCIDDKRGTLSIVR